MSKGGTREKDATAAHLWSVKERLWDAEIDKQYFADQIAEVRGGDPQAATNLLHNIALSLHPLCRRPQTHPEFSTPPESWSFIPVRYLDYICECLLQHLHNGQSLDEAFGVKRRPGRPREWNDYTERAIAAVPFKILMRWRAFDQDINVDAAIQEGVGVVLEMAEPRPLFQKSADDYDDRDIPLIENPYTLGADMTAERLWKLYSKWRPRLEEMEQRVEAAIARLINTYGGALENIPENQLTDVNP